MRVGHNIDFTAAGLLGTTFNLRRKRGCAIEARRKATNRRNTYLSAVFGKVVRDIIEIIHNPSQAIPAGNAMHEHDWVFSFGVSPPG